MLKNILHKVGNTPMVSVDIEAKANLKIFAKLEYYNPTGSVKDRAASYILNDLLQKKIISHSTTIVESSSGNFGVALSAYAKLHGLKFICVIDKTTLPINEELMKLYGTEVICIDKTDPYGGYLLNRIAKVKEIVDNTEDVYWINQYSNKLNALAYFNTIGEEICSEVPNKKVDYLFVGVSSGGTITGISNKVKQRNPDAKVIAVDVEGSIIFDGKPRKRFIPGIGSSMKPSILSYAKIDDVVTVDEEETISACKNLFQKHNLLVGGSSGSVIAGIDKYFDENPVQEDVNVVCVFADTGSKYLSTLFNNEWCTMVREKTQKRELLSTLR